MTLCIVKVVVCKCAGKDILLEEKLYVNDPVNETTTETWILKK